MPKDICVMPDFERDEITFSPIPLFLYESDLAGELANGLGPQEALDLLECMLLIRSFEQSIVEMKTGKYPPLPDYKFIGASHVSIGQEAVAAGALSAIRPDDYITSTHRGHGHSIAKGYFALPASTEDDLRGFVQVDDVPEDPDEFMELVIQEHLNRTMAELFGKEEGYCRGRGGGMHIADFNTGHLGANAIVGGSYAMATGAAMASMKLGDEKIVLCLVGDGASNNGICHESYNWSTMAQFEEGCPVIYLVENNQYGMTGQERGEVTGIDYLARRGAGYNDDNMNAEAVNGMDVLAVRDAVTRAAKKCRDGDGPVLLECMTYRYKGHSLSDTGETYRSDEEEEAWQACDAIRTFATAIVESEIASKEEVRGMQNDARERIRRAAQFAHSATDPDPASIYEGLYADTTSDEIDPKWATPRQELGREPTRQRRDGQGRILYRHAIIEALTEEMLRDRRVIVYGEDVADYGGAFQATAGLLELFGRDRVFNAPISEAAIIGTGAGASMAGMRPVVEIMYIDFILMTMDQLGNQAAKNRYMFGGKATLPMVVRTSIGGGRGYAGQHSQSLEAVTTMFPGLKVIAPSIAPDAKGLLKSAIRDDNPVVFIEHQHCYTEPDTIPDEGDDFTIPIGKARVAREGTDVTLVSYSWIYHRAMEAAEMAEEEGISVEVVDPRTLRPLDVETIAASVRKTGRMMVALQAPLIGCYGEHICYAVQEECFQEMKTPVRIVAAHDVPPPMAPPLENENLPSAEKILRNIREVVGD